MYFSGLPVPEGGGQEKPELRRPRTRWATAKAGGPIRTRAWGDLCNNILPFRKYCNKFDAQISASPRARGSDRWPKLRPSKAQCWRHRPAFSGHPEVQW